MESVLSSIKLKVKDRDCPQLSLPISNLCIHDKHEKADVLSHLQSSLKHCDGYAVSNTDVSFTLKKETFLKDILLNVVDEESRRTQRNSLLASLPRYRVVVDFSSPNIAKPFHVGHLRSTIIGNVVSNLHAYLGHDVTRINYLGDWGTQFGILSAGFEKFGNVARLEKNALEHLLTVYVESSRAAEADASFRAEALQRFRRLEAGNPDALAQWKLFRDLSVKEYSSLYERIGISFDVTSGESDYGRAALELLASLAHDSLLARREDGVRGVFVRKKNCRDGRFVPLAKSDGSSLYLTRDVAAALDRKRRYGFDVAYYVVDTSQTDHFENLKAVLEALGCDWHGTVKHVKFGRIRGMSTRKGDVVLLDSLLAEARSRAAAAMDATATTRVTGAEADAAADALGSAAVFVNALRSRRTKDAEFSWDRALHARGDSGVSLQYAHARLCSLEANAGFPVTSDYDPAALREPEATTLAVELARFEEAVLGAHVELEPCVLVQYLFGLSHAASRANKVLTVRGQADDVAGARLLLFCAARLVLAEGLRLLGVRPLTRM